MDEKKFFWPPPVADFPKWFANFTNFVTTHATVLGFTTEEVEWLTTNLNATNYTEAVIEKAYAFWRNYVNIRNIQYLGDTANAGLSSVNWIPEPDFGTAPPAIAPNIKAMLDGYVKRVATCNSITREQKREAGVLSQERSKQNPGTAFPLLKVMVVNGQAVLNCPLRGFKGYMVYVEDNGAPAIPLGISVARKYVDTRPIPVGTQTQQRTYFVQYVSKNNAPVGNISQKVTVAVLRIL